MIWQTCSSTKRKLYELLANPSQLFKDRPKFLAEVLGDYYLAVECTGFAVDESLPAPEGHEREYGQLSFEAALLKGSSNSMARIASRSTRSMSASRGMSGE